MIKTTDFRIHKLIVTQLLHETIFTFDNGRVYYLNKAGLHLSDIVNGITIIGRPDPEIDNMKVILLPDSMTFSMWVSECRTMGIVSEVLQIADYPQKPTKIAIRKIIRKVQKNGR